MKAQYYGQIYNIAAKVCINYPNVQETWEISPTHSHNFCLFLHRVFLTLKRVTLTWQHNLQECKRLVGLKYVVCEHHSIALCRAHILHISTMLVKAAYLRILLALLILNHRASTKHFELTGLLAMTQPVFFSLHACITHV